ncbi:MAG: c-type cytochrome [Acidobacteriia bacterium]|nr:c-type cytochrome [Terriglobia bacterium]
MIRSAILLALFCSAAHPQDQAAKLAYGKYLAVEVSKCVNCHTPVTDSGALDETKLMKGKVMEVQPIDTIEHWHKTSPDITPSGKLWKKWGGAQSMVQYLMTGLTPAGKPAGPPMPAYQLKKADAEAIVAYLNSLP